MTKRRRRTASDAGRQPATVRIASPRARLLPRWKHLAEFVGSLFILSAWVLHTLSVDRYDRAQGEWTNLTVLELSGTMEGLTIARASLIAGSADAIRLLGVRPSTSSNQVYQDVWQDEGVRVLWAQFIAELVEATSALLGQFHMFAIAHDLPLDHQYLTVHERFRTDSIAASRLRDVAMFGLTLSSDGAEVAEARLNADYHAVSALRKQASNLMSNRLDNALVVHAVLFGVGVVLFSTAKLLSLGVAGGKSAESDTLEEALLG